MEIHLDAQPFQSIAAEAVVTYVFDKPERLEGGQRSSRQRR